MAMGGDRTLEEDKADREEELCIGKEESKDSKTTRCFQSAHSQMYDQQATRPIKASLKTGCQSLRGVIAVENIAVPFFSPLRCSVLKFIYFEY
jgi:hypothetical protein